MLSTNREHVQHKGKVSTTITTTYLRNTKPEASRAATRRSVVVKRHLLGAAIAATEQKPRNGGEALTVPEPFAMHVAFTMQN